MPLVRIVDASFEEMDAPEVQLIVALCRGPLRPLPEPLASIDWRMCGRLWRAFRESDFEDRDGASLLISSERRLKCPATLCVRMSAGPRVEAIREAATAAVAQASALDAALCLWALPGANRLAEVSDELLDIWDKDPVAEEVRWMVPRVEQRSVRERLELHKRRRRLGQTPQTAGS